MKGTGAVLIQWSCSWCLFFNVINIRSLCLFITPSVTDVRKSLKTFFDVTSAKAPCYIKPNWWSVSSRRQRGVEMNVCCLTALGLWHSRWRQAWHRKALRFIVPSCGPGLRARCCWPKSQSSALPPAVRSRKRTHTAAFVFCACVFVLHMSIFGSLRSLATWLYHKTGWCYFSSKSLQR